MSLAIDKPYSNHESFKSANLGVDVEIKLNRKVLDSTLGFCYQLPYQFNNCYYLGDITVWDCFQLWEPEDTSSKLENQQLHWHQLAHIYSIIRHVFTSTPNKKHCTSMSIMNKVDLGKTPTLGHYYLQDSFKDFFLTKEVDMTAIQCKEFWEAGRSFQSSLQAKHQIIILAPQLV